MAEARKDGAPPGTTYECYVCGYDTRRNPWSENRDRHGRPKDDGVGVYVEGIGVRHESTQKCMKIINHFQDQRLDLSRPRHREDVQA